jgi:uncharacterized membrane protein
MNPMRSLFLSALFLLMLFAAYLWLSPRMPALIPTHWNAQGQINGYMTPLKAVIVPMIVIAGLALLTVVLPIISPRGYGIQPFGSVFAILMLFSQAFVLFIALVVLLNGAGYPMHQLVIVMVGLGLLWMLIGNYMGKLRKNFFAGIRTPWTLANDEVWERTHRMAGWLFMLAGLVTVVAALVGASLIVTIYVLLAAAIVPAVYSYVIYQRVQGKR